MEAHRPLEGLLVVDLSRHLPGPLSAKILGDLGARVVKVEEPSRGDPVRAAPPFVAGRSALAESLLGGLESIALDLGKEGARRVLRALLERADVLLESFRPGTLERFGLAPALLRETFPRLVICSVSGWGQGGPAASRAGHDLTYLAAAGSLAARPSPPAHQVADLIGAWSAATAVVASLRRRDGTGAGCHIDAALFDAAVHANLVAWAVESGSEHAVGEPLPLTGSLPCYGVYETRDGGHLAVGALERHFWEGFCEAAGRPDLAGKAYSRKHSVRRKVERVVASRTTGEWRQILRDRDLPVEVLLSPSEARRQPLMTHREVLMEGEKGGLRPAYPARFDGCRPGRSGRAPKVGEQTVALLAELGLEEGGEGVGRRQTMRNRVRELLLRWSSRATFRF